MNHTISPDRKTLTIMVDAAERAELIEMTPAIHSDSAMHDFLEPITCNSELEWIRPEWVRALTDAPILGIVRRNDNDLPKYRDKLICIREHWGWMDYQVTSLLEALRDTGRAVLVAP